MANEWRTVKLGELCSKIGSGATPRGGSKVYLVHGPVRTGSEPKRSQ